MWSVGAQFFDDRDLSIARGEADDGFDLTRLGMVAEAGTENVVRVDDSFECGLNDLLGRAETT